MLKHIQISLLIFLYFVAMLRPIAPYLEYAIDYSYISKVLCVNKYNTKINCNGKCYLSQKLKESQQKEENLKTVQITMEDYPIGFVEIFAVNKETLLAEKITKTSLNYQKHYKFLMEYSVFHPPRA